MLKVRRQPLTSPVATSQASKMLSCLGRPLPNRGVPPHRIGFWRNCKSSIAMQYGKSHSCALMLKKNLVKLRNFFEECVIQELLRARYGTTTQQRKEVSEYRPRRIAAVLRPMKLLFCLSSKVVEARFRLQNCLSDCKLYERKLSGMFRSGWQLRLLPSAV